MLIRKMEMCSWDLCNFKDIFQEIRQWGTTRYPSLEWNVEFKIFRRFSSYFEKLHYPKSSCPGLPSSNRPSYSFNYKRKPADFLMVRCRLTVQKTVFKLKRLRHESFLQSFEICVGLWQSKYLEFPS